MEKFPLISGRLSLDLINTEVVSHGKRHDLLVNEIDLIDWLVEMKKYTPFFDKSLLTKVKVEAFDILNTLKTYRLFLRKCFEDTADGKDVSNILIEHSEELIKNCPLTFKLISNHLTPFPIGGRTVDAILSLIAIDTLKLIEEHKLQSIKRCANPSCVLLFIDETGRRKWCSMKICGNRMKAARNKKKIID